MERSPFLFQSMYLLHLQQEFWRFLSLWWLDSSFFLDKCIHTSYLLSSSTFLKTNSVEVSFEKVFHLFEWWSMFITILFEFFFSRRIEKVYKKSCGELRNFSLTRESRDCFQKSRIHSKPKHYSSHPSLLDMNFFQSAWLWIFDNTCPLGHPISKYTLQILCLSSYHWYERSEYPISHHPQDSSSNFPKKN